MTANYRVSSRNNSTPFDAVEDAKSAVRWIRTHAKTLGIKKNKLVAAGGSAGGHLAASTAIVPGYENPGENLKISSKPNALILFNPVINTLPEGYGSERLGDKAESISPAHHVVKKLPRTLIFHGTEDNQNSRCTCCPMERTEVHGIAQQRARGAECQQGQHPGDPLV